MSIYSSFHPAVAFGLFNLEQQHITFLRGRYCDMTFAILEENWSVVQEVEALFFDRFPGMRDRFCSSTIGVIFFEMYKGEYPEMADLYLQAERAGHEPNATAGVDEGEAFLEEVDMHDVRSNGAGIAHGLSDRGMTSTPHESIAADLSSFDAFTPSDGGADSQAGPSRRPVQPPQTPLATRYTNRHEFITPAQRGMVRLGTPYPSAHHRPGPSRMAMSSENTFSLDDNDRTAPKQRKETNTSKRIMRKKLIKYIALCFKKLEENEEEASSDLAGDGSDVAEDESVATAPADSVDQPTSSPPSLNEEWTQLSPAQLHAAEEAALGPQEEDSFREINAMEEAATEEAEVLGGDADSE